MRRNAIHGPGPPLNSAWSESGNDWHVLDHQNGSSGDSSRISIWDESELPLGYEASECVANYEVGCTHGGAIVEEW